GLSRILCTDVVSAFWLFDLLRRSGSEFERLRDILVPVVNVGTELDPRPVPEGGLIEQANGDFLRQLDARLVAFRPRLLEFVGNAFLLGKRRRELHGIFHAHAAVAAMTVRKCECGFGGGGGKVDRLSGLES